MNRRNICDVNNGVPCIVLVNFAECRGVQLQVNFKNFWNQIKYGSIFPMSARRPIFEKHIIALVRAGERSIFAPHFFSGLQYFIDCNLTNIRNYQNLFFVLRMSSS